METIPTQTGVITNLIRRGWISLRQMGVLLGYKDPRGIYPRQQSKRKIPSVTIGGITRIYAADAIKALEDPPKGKEIEYEVLLRLYRMGLRDHERKEKKDA